jgi:hypothetical protein
MEEPLTPNEAQQDETQTAEELMPNEVVVSELDDDEWQD